ncbi:MAG TPA: phosphatase PAP2 family protein [Sporichthyaceae bacterium]|nr:phosphatase PAP2 family protein [Sporichthyaceae bacterium]
MFPAVDERLRSGLPRLPVVPTLSLGAFAALAAAVERGGRLVGLDHRIAGWLSVHRSAPVQHLALLAVSLGEPNRAPLVLLMLGATLSIVRRNWDPVRTAGVAVVALTVLVLGAKVAFGRPGPGGPVPFAAGGHGGLDAWLGAMDQGAFPSGHTTTAVVTWSVGVILLRGRLGRAGIALVAAVGLIVGWALVYAGFHWFSDVLGAYPFAIAIVWTVLRVCRPAASRTNRAEREIAPISDPAPVTTRSRACA